MGKNHCEAAFTPTGFRMNFFPPGFSVHIKPTGAEHSKTGGGGGLDLNLLVCLHMKACLVVYVRGGVDQRWSSFLLD